MLRSIFSSSIKVGTYAFNKEGRLHTQNSNLFKKQRVNPDLSIPNEKSSEGLSDDGYDKKITLASDICSLVDLKANIINEKRSYLSSYLFKISSLMNFQQYEQNKRFLDQLYYQIRKTSSQLNLTTKQLLKILIFSEKMKKYSKKAQQIGGFQIRMSFVAAQHLHNKKVTRSQAITLLYLLDSLGHKSLQVVQNLAVFLKNELKGDNNLKLQQFLIILRIYVSRKLKPGIENVLADEVISSLKLQSIQKCQDITLLTQNLRLLSSLKIWRFYKTDLQKMLSLSQSTIKKVNVKILQSLKLTQEGSRKFEQLKAKQIIVIFETLIRLVDLFHQDQKMIENCSRLKKQLFNSLVAQFKNRNSKQLQKLLFNLAFEKQATQKVNQHFSAQLYFSQKSRAWLMEELKEQNQIDTLVQKVKDNKQKFLQIDIKYHQKLLKAQKYINLALTQYFLTNLQPLEKIQFLRCLHQQITSFSTYNEREMSELMKLLFLTSKVFAQLQANYSIQLKQLVDKTLQRCFLVQINELIIASEQLNNSDSLLQLVQSYPMIWRFIQQHPIKDFQEKNFESKYLYFLFVMSCSQVEYISSKSFFLLSTLAFNQITVYEFLTDLNHDAQIKIKKQSTKRNIFCKNFLAASKNLINFSKKEIFFYHMWEIFIGHYLTQNKQTKLLAYKSLAQIFHKAIQKQSARRVVLLTYLTNLMAEGSLIVSSDQLKKFLESVLAITLSSQKSFHYHCYVKIVKNAIVADILSLESFVGIIKIGKQQGNVQLSNTCLLLLLFGMYLRINNLKSSLLSDQAINNQLVYLKKTMKSIRFYRSASKFSELEQNQQQSTEVTGPFIGVLLMSGLPEISYYASQISQFIANCRIYLQFKLLLKAYQMSDFKNLKQVQKTNMLKIHESFLCKIEVFSKSKIDDESLITSKQNLKSLYAKLKSK